MLGEWHDTETLRLCQALMGPFFIIRYGLGTVYLKVAKYNMAEHHFRIAVGINSRNAVLICCVGMVSPLILTFLVTSNH